MAHRPDIHGRGSRHNGTVSQGYNSPLLVTPSHGTFTVEAWRRVYLLIAAITISTMVSGCASLALTQPGSSASLQFTPATVNFGDVDIGSDGSADVTLTNQSTRETDVSDLQVSGHGFTVQGQPALPMALPAGASRRITLKFSPDAEADFSGEVSAVDNRGRPLASMRIYGRGRRSATHRLSVNASSLDFGSAPLNSSVTRSLTASSTGTGPVTIDSVTISGSAFTIAGASFPMTLQSGESVVLNITFKPAATVAIAEQLTVVSNSERGGTTTVSLTGTGTALPVTRLSLNTASLSFGNVTVDASATKAITLTSTGNGPVTVKSAVITGTGYTFSGTAFPVSLDPGATLILQVSFFPKAAGSSSGTLTINSDGSTATVTLSGTGVANPVPQLTLSTSSLSFGNITLNSPSTKAITLNSTGTGALTISSMSISGPGFTFPASPLPIRLNPGQTVAVQVTFDPTVAGPSTGTLTITSDSSTGPAASVSLTGTGTDASSPMLSISTASVDFGNTALGVPLVQVVTLSSTGNAAVTVSNATVSGAGFAISGVSFPVTLNPSIAIKLTVTFNPLSLGRSTGQITISSNSSLGSTNVVLLSGAATAAEHVVDLTWSAPSNSPVKVAGYGIYRAISGSKAFSLLNPTATTQTSYVDSTVQSGMKYDYYVTSVDAFGAESAPSNEISLSIP